MAREYSKVSPRFWSGATGRQIRAFGSDCMVVALYLMTAPGSNMIGLYYLPLSTLAHETGLTIEGASRALARLSDAGFAEYDAENEEVWIPEMASYQIAPSLEPKDKRVAGLTREMHGYRKSRFFGAFMERYRGAFKLPDISPLQAPSKPLASPIEAVPAPHRSQDQDQEQDQEHAHRARWQSADWRTGLQQRWLALVGPAGWSAPGLADLADLVERVAQAEDRDPAVLFEQMTGSFLAWVETCTHRPGVTPNKLIEHWALIWGRITRPLTDDDAPAVDGEDAGTRAAIDGLAAGVRY